MPMFTYSPDDRITNCPDLLCYELLGGTDTWRGRVILAFLWLMRCWPIRAALREEGR